MSKLTDRERQVIKKLDHGLYTVEFVDEWLSRESENVFMNAPASLQRMGVEGFMSAVRSLCRLESEDRNKDCAYS